MLTQQARFVYANIMGWKLIGQFPDNVDKCVVIVIPHTHWLDFPLGIIIRKIINKKINYIGKKSLFKPPYGWFFRWMGGRPVDRSTNQNMVDAIVDVFNKNDTFRFALAPEGTRKKVDALKTGFYYIAQKANVPLVMVAFDYGKKEVKFSQPLYTTASYESDMAVIRSFYKDVKGKIPEYSFGV